MLPHCSHVNLFEYVPSVRLTKRCHYWDVAEDSSCTFGVWHPLAAEKLLALALNVASDQSVFSDGYVQVLGYDTLQCWSDRSAVSVRVLDYDSQQPIGVQSMHKCLAVILCSNEVAISVQFPCHDTSECWSDHLMSECLATVLHSAGPKNLLCGNKNEEYGVL